MSLPEPAPSATVPDVAARRRLANSVESGTARAAVLGINDGLVTNVALILGLVGADAEPRVVALAGLASLFAGAGSMAVGEWVSMRAQVDLFQRILADQREAMRTEPGRERALLRDALRRTGLDGPTAETVAAQLSRDDERALALYASTVLGMNPAEPGSPWKAAVSSLITFALGALTPLLPWLFRLGDGALPASLGLAGAAALVIGGVLGHMTDGRVARSAARQLLVLAMAAGATFLIGRLFGTTVA